jgi:hypothetical protein
MIEAASSFDFALPVQNAPLTEHQQAAIVALSHAVAERPFPPNLAQDHVSHPDNALSVSVSAEDSSVRVSAPTIQPFLVNTNQVSVLLFGSMINEACI